jgi:hypothetical protein
MRDDGAGLVRDTPRDSMWPPQLLNGECAEADGSPAVLDHCGLCAGAGDGCGCVNVSTAANGMYDVLVRQPIQPPENRGETGGRPAVHVVTFSVKTCSDAHLTIFSTDSGASHACAHSPVQKVVH